MTLIVRFTNPYSAKTVKELLEEDLLIPRKIRHFLRTKKHITINGSPINWQSPVQKGDWIEMVFDDQDYPLKHLPFGDKRLVDCLYEDEHLIVVNKPEGLKTHANQPYEIALLNHVSAYVGQTCYVVHRLDMETSGAILFAKNPFILPLLNRLLEDKQIQRCYWALASGHFPQKTMIYRDKIGRDRHDRRKRIVDTKKGQTAHTRLTLLKEYPAASLVDCELKTGRTHQIRVHLAHHGHAIIGDPLYHLKKGQRLMLHAHELVFRHPLTLEQIRIQAPSKSFENGLPK